MDTHLPLVSAWQALLFSLTPVFTAPTMPTFVELLTAWVLCHGRHTVTAMLPFRSPQEKRSHDVFHRLLSRARWEVRELFRRWAGWAVVRFAPTGRVPIDLDDTVFHQSGPRVDGAGWWRDAVRSTDHHLVHARGLNLVVLTLRVRAPWGGEPLGLPLGVRLHRKGGPTLLDLAAELVRDVAEWLPARQISLCADGFYAPLAGRQLPRTHLTSRLRRDAALYEAPARPRRRTRGRPRAKGRRLPALKEIAARTRRWPRVETEERGRTRHRVIHTRVVLWYAVCGTQPVRLVISRDPTRKEEDDFFVTTMVEAAPAQVVGQFAGRWSIEDTFRNVKQYLHAEDPQTWRGPGPERAAALGFLLYGLVWAWYLEHAYGRHPLQRPVWYTHKAHPSFQDALSALRLALWQKRISPSSGRHSFPTKIVRLLLRALVASA